uniref:FYVE, RhoGEF and PH domain-containing protein 6 isoform X1 n=1 Tax=Petromyzon marinus TaxID=7757 RepID=A0AAJ7U1Q9_PETMA|nr:FYVE, RhoGEF and PH domain-containing protein 6 isoform X1 [Petromyzon marinus]
MSTGQSNSNHVSSDGRVLRRRLTAEIKKPPVAPKPRLPAPPRPSQPPRLPAPQVNHTDRANHKDQGDHTGEIIHADRASHSDQINHAPQANHADQTNHTDRVNDADQISQTDQANHTGQIAHAGQANHASPRSQKPPVAPKPKVAKKPPVAEVKPTPQQQQAVAAVAAVSPADGTKPCRECGSRNRKPDVPATAALLGSCCCHRHLDFGAAHGLGPTQCGDGGGDGSCCLCAVSRVAASCKGCEAACRFRRVSDRHDTAIHVHGCEAVALLLHRTEFDGGGSGDAAQPESCRAAPAPGSPKPSLPPPPPLPPRLRSPDLGVKGSESPPLAEVAPRLRREPADARAAGAIRPAAPSAKAGADPGELAPDGPAVRDRRCTSPGGGARGTVEGERSGRLPVAAPPDAGLTPQRPASAGKRSGERSSGSPGRPRARGDVGAPVPKPRRLVPAPHFPDRATESVASDETGHDDDLPEGERFADGAIEQNCPPARLRSPSELGAPTPTEWPQGGSTARDVAGVDAGGEMVSSGNRSPAERPGNECRRSTTCGNEPWPPIGERAAFDEHVTPGGAATEPSELGQRLRRHEEDAERTTRAPPLKPKRGGGNVQSPAPGTAAELERAQRDGDADRAATRRGASVGGGGGGVHSIDRRRPSFGPPPPPTLPPKKEHSRGDDAGRKSSRAAEAVAAAAAAACLKDIPPPFQPADITQRPIAKYSPRPAEGDGRSGVVGGSGGEGKKKSSFRNFLPLRFSGKSKVEIRLFGSAESPPAQGVCRDLRWRGGRQQQRGELATSLTRRSSESQVQRSKVRTYTRTGSRRVTRDDGVVDPPLPPGLRTPPPKPRSISFPCASTPKHGCADSDAAYKSVEQRVEQRVEQCVVERVAAVPPPRPRGRSLGFQDLLRGGGGDPRWGDPRAEALRGDSDRRHRVDGDDDDDEEEPFSYVDMNSFLDAEDGSFSVAGARTGRMKSFGDSIQSDEDVPDTSSEDNDEDDEEEDREEEKTGCSMSLKAPGTLLRPRASPLSDVEVKRNKAFHIAREMVSSERVFVDVLKLLHIDFRGAVVSAGVEAGKPLVDDKTLSQILLYLPQLYELNQSLLQELEERMAHWEEERERIADVIMRKGPYLKMYSAYIKEFDRITLLLDECCRKCPPFAAVVRDFEMSPRCANLALKHHLLKPVQRIPQYRLLLTDYLKNLTPESADYKDTQAALAMVSEVADHANDSMKQGDNFEKLMQIQYSLTGHHEIVQPGRVFLKEGTLMKLSRKVMQPRVFYLMNDTLLYTTPQQGGTYKLNNMLSLAGMKVSKPSQEAYQNELIIVSVERSFILSASSASERDEWLLAISCAIDDYTRKRISFTHTCGGAGGDGGDGGGDGGSGQMDTFQRSESQLGHKAPIWIPDSRVTMCMICTCDFTLTWRRHHCRACGKIICQGCSYHRYPLKYRKDRPERVCDQCYASLGKRDKTVVLGRSPPSQSRSPGGALSSVLHSITPSPGRKLKRVPAALKQVAGTEGSSMSGYLQRSKDNRKPWRRLWFVVKDKVLYTYAASEDVVAMESQPLLGFTVQGPTARDCSFQLFHKTTLFRAFRAEDSATALRWAEAIKAATVLETGDPLSPPF